MTNIEAVQEKYVQFINKLRSLMISTIDQNGDPSISYAPFVQYEGKIYIYISKIAKHYDHLERQSKADIMFIEDEMDTANLFARQRVRFQCQALNVGNEGHEEVFAAFAARFPEKMIQMLRSLDFSLFELTPGEGRYVAGFGQAYDIDMTTGSIEHVARDGHTAKA
ncbi:HugZ family pyridoxamine 5'-phosphate oxidase [Paenibacillus urinalis]|uniref:HugZ family pyridoxamine 5'-phosphate oxidase n=1 Tax=Paenibacillus urinalis TaxID=521520 RepID=UPI001961B1AE